MASVSKHEKHNQKSHAGKKRVAPSAGGKVPKSSGSKKQVDASTKKVVDLITQEAGAETAKRLEPAIRESFKQFYSGDINKPLVVNGKKVTNQGRNLTAKDMLDSIANQFGTEAVTGISGADFASGDAFRRVVKANPYHDERGRFTSKPNAAAAGGRRFAMGPEGVEMQLATPVARLSKRHGVQKDWKTVVSVDPQKRVKIAGFYSKMRDMDNSPEVKKAWDDAEVEIKAQFEQLTKRDGIKVVFVKDDPYKSFHDMHEQVTKTGVLKILKTESTGGHPYWKNETNDMFRAVHDAYGHLATGRGFDRHGEEAAYQAHRSMFSESAQRVLATELRAQNQFLIANGYFGPQKVGFIPSDLMKLFMAIVSKVFMGRASITSDDDNFYGIGRSHHVSCGRNFASNMKKADPTSTDVHVPTIMNNQKKRKRRTKKMMVSEVVEKKERLKDPKGGLTAAGRAHFKRTEGANLKPGVRGKADTPEKMRRKGSFLTRFFTNPSGPMKDEKGRPTRLALSAAAWGEPVPSDRAAAARLAAKGRRLLERYDNLKKDEELEKFNPNHDQLGRFTSASGRTVSRPKALRARGGKRGIYQGLKGRAMTELTRTGEKVGARGKTKGYIYNPKTGKTTPHGFD